MKSFCLRKWMVVGFLLFCRRFQDLKNWVCRVLVQIGNLKLVLSGLYSLHLIKIQSFMHLQTTISLRLHKRIQNLSAHHQSLRKTPGLNSFTQHVCISPDCFQASVLAAAVILRLRVKLAVSAAPFLSLIETLTWCRSIALSASCNHELLMHSGCHTCIYAQIAFEVCIMLLCYERWTGMSLTQATADS